MTTLDVLKNRDKRTANGILAAAALASSPNSGIGDDIDLITQYADDVRKLLTEVREKLRIPPDSDHPMHQTSIDQFLVREMKSAFITADELEQAYERAAQAGTLSPSLYEVSETELFAKTFPRLGVRKPHVESAIRQPDDYQHLLSERAIDAERNSISLFMKWVPSTKDAFWLLVQTHRQGRKQVAQAAWRIYPPDMEDLAEAKEPLDVLKIFVNKYGSAVKVGGRDVLFIDSQLFPAGTDLKVDWSNLLDHFVALSHTMTRDPTVFQVGIVYAIDLNRYSAALAKHGVKVT